MSHAGDGEHSGQGPLPPRVSPTTTAAPRGGAIPGLFPVGAASPVAQVTAGPPPHRHSSIRMAHRPVNQFALDASAGSPPAAAAAASASGSPRHRGHHTSSRPAFQKSTVIQPSELADFRATFEKFDADHSGTIEFHELRNLMFDMGHDLSERDVQRLIAMVSVKPNAKSLQFEELVQLLTIYKEAAQFKMLDDDDGDDGGGRGRNSGTLRRLDSGGNLSAADGTTTRRVGVKWKEDGDAGGGATAAGDGGDQTAATRQSCRAPSKPHQTDGVLQRIVGVLLFHVTERVWHRDAMPIVLWHLALTVAISYGLVTSAYYATMSDTAEIFATLRALAATNSLLLVVFLWDMLLSCKIVWNTSHVTPLEACLFYLKAYGLLDFLGTVPLDLILLPVLESRLLGEAAAKTPSSPPLAANRSLEILLPVATTAGNADALPMAYLCGLIIAQRLLRVPKLFVAAFRPSGRLSASRNHVIVKEYLVPILVAVCQMIVMIQFLACGWLRLRREQDHPSEEYSEALLFVAYSICAVGYGNITFATTAQRLVAAFFCVLATGTSALIIGATVQLMGQFDVQNRNRHQVLQALRVAKMANVGEAVEHEVAGFQQHMVDTSLSDSYHDLIASLPEELKSNIQLFVRLQLITAHPLFVTAHRSTHVALAREIDTYVLSPMDAVFCAGEIVNEMCIVGFGVVELVSEGGQLECYVKKGESLNERVLLAGSEQVKLTARCLTHCELYLLSRRSFLTVCRRFPVFKTDMARLASVVKHSDSWSPRGSAVFGAGRATTGGAASPTPSFSDSMGTVRQEDLLALDSGSGLGNQVASGLLDDSFTEELALLGGATEEDLIAAELSNIEQLIGRLEALKSVRVGDVLRSPGLTPRSSDGHPTSGFRSIAGAFGSSATQSPSSVRGIFHGSANAIAAWPHAKEQLSCAASSTTTTPVASAAAAAAQRPQSVSPSMTTATTAAALGQRSTTPLMKAHTFAPTPPPVHDQANAPILSDAVEHLLLPEEEDLTARTDASAVSRLSETAVWRNTMSSCGYAAAAGGPSPPPSLGSTTVQGPHSANDQLALEDV